MVESIGIERYRTDLARHRVVRTERSPADGEIVAAIELAAITANNLTYATYGGPPMHYWDFFPASSADWGIIPLWGFATVVESRVAEVAAGTRLYGYWPSASHLLLSLGPVGATGFTDLTEHRQALAPVYNRYRIVGAADPARDPLIALFQPLYGTGFVLDLALADTAPPGTLILLTSASAKTALATAFNLSRRGVEAIGLTSTGNRGFVERTGCYARVLTYDEVETLPPDRPAVLVDIAGNADVRARIHAQLPTLLASHVVGDTHRKPAAPAALPGPTPEFFFAPTHFEARIRAMGAASFEAALAASLSAFLADCTRWLRVETVAGPSGHAQAFDALLNGRADPSVGTVWRP